MLGRGQPGWPRGSAESFGFAAAGWSLGWWEVAGRMHGCSVGRCWVCLGPGIIYSVLLLVPIPAIFAVNSSILAGAGLTSSTSGVSGRARWSCLQQQSSAAGPAAPCSRMRPQEDCDSCPASPNPTLPVLPYPHVSQSMGGPMEQVFLPAWIILPQHHPCTMRSILVPRKPLWYGNSQLAALRVPPWSPSSAVGLGESQLMRCSAEKASGLVPRCWSCQDAASIPPQHVLGVSPSPKQLWPSCARRKPS